MLKDTLKRKNNCYIRKRNISLHRILQSVVFRNIFVFILGVFIGGASIGHKPCVAGVSFVGALGGGLPAFGGLFGVIVGYLWFHGVTHSFIYIGSAIFIFTIKYLFQFTVLYRSKAFMPLVVFLIIILVRAYGTINVVRGSIDRAWGYCFEGILGAFLTYVYSLSLRWGKFKISHEFYAYSLYMLLATVLTIVPGVSIFHKLSLNSIICTAILMNVLHEGLIQSYPIAAMLGSCLEFGLTSRENAVILFMIYSIADIFLFKKSKCLLTIYIVLTSFLCELYFNHSNELIWRLSEVLIGSLAFLCITKKISLSDRMNIDANEISKQKIASILNLSELMISLGDETNDNSNSIHNDFDLDYVFDNAFEEVCSTCEKKVICWEKRHIDSTTLVHNAAKHIADRGRLELDDLPNYFRVSCIRCHSIVLAVNYELRRRLLSERLAETELENIQICKRQNRMLGEILHSLPYIRGNRALNVCDFNGHQQYCVEIGLASIRKQGESVCGDSAKYFKTDDGILYVILSDGMGSGEEARNYSQCAVSVLENSLRALNNPFIAFELTLQAFQSLNSWAAATIDLLTVNLNSGELSFFKYGASQSYVISNNEILLIEGNSCSIGTRLNFQEFSSANFQATTDTTVILSSDGVTLDINDASLTSIFRKPYNMKRTAKQILLCNKEDSYDDRTVIAISIKNIAGTV